MLFSKILTASEPKPVGKPPVPGPATPPQPEPSSIAPEGPPRALILVVDDSAMIRTAVTKTLTANRYAVVAADCGENGLAEWEKQQTDIKLVLSDVFMPGIDGLTFARRLRQRSRTLPIILMSSKLDEDSRWIAEEAGFRLLPKPFKDELMLELINRMLRLAYPGI